MYEVEKNSRYYTKGEHAMLRALTRNNDYSSIVFFMEEAVKNPVLVAEALHNYWNDYFYHIQDEMEDGSAPKLEEAA